MPDRLHELAEARSLALHRLVAERLIENPAHLDGARARVESWIADGSVHPMYAHRWREILARPLDEVVGVITDSGEEARALRQVSPFAGIVDARTRWRVWRSVREAMELS
jgi:hypothetical protein